MKLKLLLVILLFSRCCNGQVYLGRVINVAPTDSLANISIVADGNSYFSNIFGYTPSPNIIVTIPPFNDNGATIQNFGVSGQTTSMMLSDFSTQILPLYNSSVYRNVIIFQEGGNDLYYYGSVDSAIARVIRYCNIARAAGFKIIVSTLIHRNQSTPFGDDVTQYNDKIDAYNAAIILLTNSYDGIIRPDVEDIFSTYSSGGYHSDDVHPNQLGHNKYAELWKAAILNL